MDPIAAIVAILNKDRTGEHKQALREWLAQGGRKPRISEVRKASLPSTKWWYPRPMQRSCMPTMPM